MKTKIAAVVLAAGSSTRMGRPKQLLSISNTTLLEKVLTQVLASQVEKVFCVLGACGQEIESSIEHLDIEVVHNRDFKLGLSASVKAGLEVVEDQGFDALLLVLGDQPEVDSAYVNRLISIHQESKEIVASSYGERAGVPAIIPRFYFDNLRTLEGDRGARNFLNGEAPVCKIDGGRLIDLDTVEDYKRYLG